MARICGICNTEPSKYKCPSCEIPYCSLACYKPHKTEHENPEQETTVKLTLVEPNDSGKNPKSNKDKDEKNEKDTEIFSPLLESPGIQRMLASPSLRRHLLKIHRATLEPPPEFAHRGRGGRGRGRGRGRGGRGGWEQNTPRPWNAEKGTRVGIAKVRRLRSENMEVDEFINMVVDLVEKETTSEEK